MNYIIELTIGQSMNFDSQNTLFWIELVLRQKKEESTPL
jgi:hypothetical protein